MRKAQECVKALPTARGKSQGLLDRMTLNIGSASKQEWCVMTSGFSYGEAFVRNIGWFTDYEQQTLRSKTIAIAGMGGVGGVHALTMARLGVANFKMADMDTFDIANFNRQAGAMMSTLGQSKVEVLARMVKDINPEAKISEFPNGVSTANVEEFLSGVDLFIDGFDFFVLDIRRSNT